MPLGLFVFIAWMVFMVLFLAVSIIWGLGRGQFRDIEEPKYRMLEDREPEPWPGRERAGALPVVGNGGNNGSERA